MTHPTQYPMPKWHTLFDFLLSASLQVRPTVQLCLLLSYLQLNYLQAQTAQDSFRLERSLPLTARFASTDNLGNLYLISPQNALEKYAPDNQLLARYSNNRLGAATSVDVTNPLKVLVWYADFRTVVFLDRTLNQLGELNLISAGYPEVRSIAAAADGNLWLYDEVAFQLKKITPGGETRFESPALNQIQTGRISISAIRDNGQEVLAADSEQGLLRFDTYAQFQQTLAWEGIENFVLDDETIAFCSDSTLRLDQIQAFASREIPLPTVALQANNQHWLAPGRLLVQNGKRLEVWKWQ